MVNEEIKILIFNLNGEKYATKINNVERIYNYVEPTELPNVPSYIKGVINYESKILPVLSLYNKFNFGNEVVNETNKIIIVKKEGKGYGILVDNVYEVKSVNTEAFEEAPQIATGISQRYITGLIKLDGSIIILLDLSKILSEEEEGHI